MHVTCHCDAFVVGAAPPTVNVEDVVITGRQLPDKSSADDPIPIHVLKEDVDLITAFLTQLYNCSWAVFRN